MADIRLLDEQDRKEIDREIDSLKQSGVESNKILVDALNSKKVSASTNDTIKTNVGKVKDIHVGDYSIGNTLDLEDIELIYTDDLEPPTVWEYDNGSSINEIIVNKLGYIYMLSGRRLKKLDRFGRLIWEMLFTGEGSGTCMTIDDKGDLYIGSDAGKVHKVNASGVAVWSLKCHETDGWGSQYSVRGIAVANDGYVFSTADDSYICKIDRVSGKLLQRENVSIGSFPTMVVDNDKKRIYVGCSRGDISYFYFTLEKGWTYSKFRADIKRMDLDKSGNIYAIAMSMGNTDRMLHKVNSSGYGLWNIDIDSYPGNVAVGEGGEVYVSYQRTIEKFSAMGNLIWAHTADIRTTSVGYLNGLALSGDNIYFGMNRAKNIVRKIKNTNIKSVKIIK